MSKTYAYVRVSTRKQTLSRQIRNITNEYPKAIIYKEYYTGTKQNRPEWSKLLNVVKQGDCIVMDSVSRMSRASEPGFLDYKMLFERGVELVFLKEPHINTTVFKAAASNIIKLSISTGNDAVDTFFKGNIALINKLLLELAEQQILLAFQQSEKEVSDLHERISEGLIGKKTGPKKGTSYNTVKSLKCIETIKKHSLTFGGNLTDEEVMLLCGCSRNSFYKYKRMIKSGK